MREDRVPSPRDGGGGPKKRIEVVAWFVRWQRDDPGRQHEFNCTICQRERFYERRVCFLRDREAPVHVPIFEKHIANPNVCATRVLRADDVLRLVSDVRRARASTRIGVDRPPAFEVVWGMLRVCPAFYQFDRITQDAVRIGSMLEGGYDVAELPAWFVDLAQIASSTMADYAIRKMDDQKKRIEQNAAGGRK